MHYVDMDFPPVATSIAPTPGPGAAPALDTTQYSWRRPAQFFADGGSEGKGTPAGGDGSPAGASAVALPFDVFIGGVEPNDIRQGQLADCWYATSPRVTPIDCAREVC